MRTSLQLFLGCKRPFTATVGKFGLRHQFCSGDEPTMLLKNLVLHAHGGAEIPIDHVWVSVGKKIARHNPRRGDVLRFDARVREYYKFNRHTGLESLDYCIGHLTAIERLEAGNGLDFATFWSRLKESRRFVTDRIEVPCTALAASV